MRRVVLLSLCLALTAPLAVGTGAIAQEGGRVERVRVALPGYENNITPFTITFGATPYTHDLLMLVYDSLFWSQVSEDPEPWLAERAEPSPDNKVWTVTLREGVKWHDGRPLTADDVKFSFDYYLKAPGASGRYAHHVSDVPPFERAEVLDPRTVRFFYKAPAPQFKILPGADLPIIPQHVWESVTEPTKAAGDLPVGSGPYKVVEMVPDQRYRLVANDDYFKGRPTVAELDLPIVRDPSAAFAALRTGEVDSVARNVPPELVGQFSGRGGVAVAKGTKFESVHMYFNARKPPLTDAKLRKAISLAVDTTALVDTVILGRGKPGLDTFIHPDSPWAAPGGTHQHDPARAGRLLDEAGYTAKDPDGVRKTPDGKRLEFAVLASSFAPQEIRAIQVVAQQVAPIGVKLNPDVLDPATLRQRRQPPGPGQAPPYDAYMATLESHGHVDPDALYYFFHSPGPKGFGAAISGYSNPRFDAIAEAATTTDLDQRKPMLHDLQRLLAEEAPVIMFWYPDGEYGFRPDAYDRWVSDRGHGIFTKRSFLPDYAKEGAAGRAVSGRSAGEDDGGGSGGTVALIAVAAAVVLVGVAVAVSRRRRAEAEAEE